MDLKEALVGVVATVVIGGTAYTINQADLVDNFAENAGLTQEQAEEYIDSLDEDDLATFDEIGDSYIVDGNDILGFTAEIDCVNYTYEWESSSLSCTEGVKQLTKAGNDSVALGESYKKLDQEGSDEADMLETISLIDVVNADYDLEIVKALLTEEDILETKRIGSYNKSLLEAVIEND